MPDAKVTKSRAARGMLGALALVLTLGSGSARATEDFDKYILKGDAATACEVILCLASSVARPGACTKPLLKFFSIKKPWKRKNFLKLCPRTSGPGPDDLALIKDNPDEVEVAKFPPLDSYGDPNDVEFPGGIPSKTVQSMIAAHLKTMGPLLTARNTALTSYQECFWSGNDCDAAESAMLKAADAYGEAKLQYDVLLIWHAKAKAEEADKGDKEGDIKK